MGKFEHIYLHNIMSLLAVLDKQIDHGIKSDAEINLNLNWSLHLQPGLKNLNDVRF